MIVHKILKNLHTTLCINNSQFICIHSSLIQKRLLCLTAAHKMKFDQFQRKNDDKVRIGVLSDDGLNLTDLSGALTGDLIQFIQSFTSIDEISAKVNSLKSDKITGDVRLLSPVTSPEKIVCIGLNYLGHCKEQNKEPPKEPMFFSKFASAITGPTGDVKLHQITNVSFSMSSRMFALSTQPISHSN